MSNPIITIAIPVFNGMPYIENAIQSVINQTYKNWTLILLNDGSNDDSLSILLDYSFRDSRIKVINDGKNEGLIYRLNQSIQLTQTKYYARMDADDIMYITRLEDQINYLESHPEVDVIGSSIMTIDNNNNIIGSGICPPEYWFIHPTVVGKTQWFKKNPYATWAERAEDFELWCRTSGNSVFYSLEKPLLFYREFGVPTLNKTLKSLRTTTKIYRNYREYNKSFWWFCKGYVLSVIKMIIYIIFFSIGKIDYIVSKRQRKQVQKNLCLDINDLNKSILKRNNQQQ